MLFITNKCEEVVNVSTAVWTAFAAAPHQFFFKMLVDTDEGVTDG
jgi:hypothetical protein